MKCVLLALVAISMCSTSAHSQLTMQQYEQYETACTNFIVSQDYPQHGAWFHEHIKRICIESAAYDPEFVTEWLPKEEDQLDAAIRACKTKVTKKLKPCLELEIQKIERLGQH